MSDEKADGIGPGQGFDSIFEEGGAWSEFLMGIRKTTEEIGQDLAWDDDWMPVVFVDGTFPADMPGLDPAMAGKTGRLVIGFAGDIMADDESKDWLAGVMGGLALKTLATGMVFLSTVWMSQLRQTPADDDPNESEEHFRERMEEEARRHGPPSKDPNRKEALMILSVQHGGEDDGTKLIFADIKRERDKPPQLQNWRLTDNMGAVGMMGRFPEAIYGGLKLASMMREVIGTQDREGEEWKEGQP